MWLHGSLSDAPVSSKMALCLVQIGCSMKQKIDIFSFCTRKGYCKDGYCAYRAGDLTPRLDIRPEVFALTSVKTPDTPCIDGCCPTQLALGTCTQNATLATVRTPGRSYRKEEVKLPPRQYVCSIARSLFASWLTVWCSLAQGRSALGREPELRPHALQHSARRHSVTLEMYQNAHASLWSSCYVSCCVHWAKKAAITALLWHAEENSTAESNSCSQ